MSEAKVVEHLRNMSLKGSPTFQPLLPVVFSLKGKPFTLNDHFPFEPMYKCEKPYETTLLSGRQVSKTTNLATTSLLNAAATPHLATICVTPLYESIRRFSSNYVRKFVDESPVKRLFVNRFVERNVMQRTWRNGSAHYFSFAFLDATRTRGLSGDNLLVDEIQDMDRDNLNIINETISASKRKRILRAGTPLTLDNIANEFFDDSSGAEWCMRCGCGKWNIPNLENDLEKIIGPYRDDISEEKPGLVCARCSKPLQPRNGIWVHARRERRKMHAGYRVPQFILPIHYAYPESWSILLSKLAQLPYHTFLNEVCGIATDIGAKLITETDLKRAAVLDENTIENAKAVINNYIRVVVSVDWGGGGAEGVSFTVIAVLGMLPDGRIDVIYGKRSMTPHAHLDEAKLILDTLQQVRATHIVHDYTGAGSIRETFIVQAGFPVSKIVPITYVRSAAQDIMVHKPPTRFHPRSYYSVDKARSLVLLCNQIKTQQIRFFAYDYKSSGNAGLLHDFLALTEEKMSRNVGSDMYTIGRLPKRSDDFAQAVNIGCCALWYMTQKWPQLASTEKFKISPAEASRLNYDAADIADYDEPY